MRVLVFANGEIDDLVAPDCADGVDLILCANGGTHHARVLGLRPHVVIGDLDSLSQELCAELKAAGTEFVSFSRAKDETDLELALLYAVDRGAKQIVVLGARGGRVDHELGNFLLLAHPGLQGTDVRVRSGRQEIVLVRSEAGFRGSPGDLLSLLPIGGDAYGIETRGLAYPLNGETLYFGPARGVSNVFTTQEPIVRLRSGLLLAVHTRCS